MENNNLHGIVRPSGRQFDQLRKIEFIPNYSLHPEGSCFVKFGDTHVLCTASIEDRVPFFLRNTGKGWVTAEYGMLPRSTNSRMQRESAKGKQSGRTLEIQRLIGRSLRSTLDLSYLGEKQIIIDCDVIQADGGTRTASITGGWVAMSLALRKLLSNGKIPKNPLIGQVAAISCGIWKGSPVLDLDYSEDSNAETDANFVLTSDNRIIEIQATAETNPFYYKDFNFLMKLAQAGTKKLFELQKIALT